MSSHLTHCWWANRCTLQHLREGLQEPQGWTLQSPLWELQDLLSCIISHFSSHNLFSLAYFRGLCRATCLTGTEVTGTVSTFLYFTASRGSNDKQVSCSALKMRAQQHKNDCPNKLFSCYITGYVNSPSPRKCLALKALFLSPKATKIHMDTNIFMYLMFCQKNLLLMIEFNIFLWAKK